MSSIQGYVDYSRREYCRAVHCPIQALLERETEGSDPHQFIRGICARNCLHTTHEFHAWLNQQGYLVVRPQP